MYIVVDNKQKALSSEYVPFHFYFKLSLSAILNQHIQFIPPLREIRNRFHILN